MSDCCFGGWVVANKSGGGEASYEAAITKPREEMMLYRGRW